MPLPVRLSGIALVAALTGCASLGEDAPHQWAEEFAHAREQTTSQFAQDVLADDEISDEEYQETKQRYIQCFADAGYPGASFDEGDTFSLPDQGYTHDDVQRLRRECDAALGFNYLQSLYLETRQNPSNEDPSSLIASCLVRHEVVDPSYQGKDYDADLERFFSSSAEDADPAEAITYTDPERGPEAFYQCATDPSA